MRVSKSRGLRNAAHAARYVNYNLGYLGPFRPERQTQVDQPAAKLGPRRAEEPCTG